MCAPGDADSADPANPSRFTEVAHPSFTRTSLSTMLDYNYEGHPPPTCYIRDEPFRNYSYYLFCLPPVRHPSLTCLEKCWAL